MATTAEAERPELDETSPDLKTAATATATTTERHAPTTEESDLQAEVSRQDQSLYRNISH
jgi:hypothetical protein